MNEFGHLKSTLVAFTKLHKSCNIKVTEELGMSELQLKQFGYVNIIGTKEWITYGELAEILGITKPSVTSIVNKMIRLGIVEKHQCSKDGRVYYLKLTEKGNLIYNTYDLVADKTATIILNKLEPEEVIELVRLLDKVLK